MTIAMILEGSSGFIFHPLSHIDIKILVCCVLTWPSTAQNHQHVVVFTQHWTNAAPTLNRAFSQTNTHPIWIQHVPLISMLINSHNFTFRLFNTILGTFSMFFWKTERKKMTIMKEKFATNHKTAESFLKCKTVLITFRRTIYKEFVSTGQTVFAYSILYGRYGDILQNLMEWAQRAIMPSSFWSSSAIYLMLHINA